MKKTLIYFIQSPVHLRNARQMQRQMDDCEIRIIFEHGLPCMKTEDTFFGKGLTIIQGVVPQETWDPFPHAVIFSAMHPRLGPLALIDGALQRNVFVFAIEESNQLSLNCGRVNNYLLPAHLVWMASKVEQEWMIKQGVAPERTAVSGWPFYTGSLGKPSAEEKLKAKDRLHLPAKKIAALTLTALHAAGESSDVRIRQLELAAKNLPMDWVLAVKPHPVETLDQLMPFIEQYAPLAVVLDGSADSNDLLQSCDVLLNRGVSQVAYEALLQNKPVIVLDTGVETPFDSLPEQCKVKNSHDLPQALEFVNREESFENIFQPFKIRHLPIDPDTACQLIHQGILSADAEILNRNNDDLWFLLSLYFAWEGSIKRSLEILESLQGSEQELPLDSLTRLVSKKANGNDFLKLRSHWKGSFYHGLIQSLWIIQKEACKSIEEQDLMRMSCFPPPTHVGMFNRYTLIWGMLLSEKQSTWADLFLKMLTQKYLNEYGVREVINQIQGKIKKRPFWEKKLKALLTRL